LDRDWSPDGLQIIWFHSGKQKDSSPPWRQQGSTSSFIRPSGYVVPERDPIASAFQFFDSNNHLHRDLRYHPEQPLRISSCVEALDKFRRENPSHLLELIDVTTGHQLIEGASHQPFTEEELMLETVCLQAHTPDLVTQLEERSRNLVNNAYRWKACGHMGNIDADTYVTTESFNVCLRQQRLGFGQSTSPRRMSQEQQWH
jgi:hypothetical protein